MSGSVAVPSPVISGYANGMSRRPRESAARSATPPPAADATVDPGHLVRDLRERVGLTQRQLAIRAGTTTTAISRLERGHVSPTVQTLDRLLFCLGHRLVLGAAPLPLDIDTSQLDAVAHLSPDERLALALASQAQVHHLFGAARRGSPGDDRARPTRGGPA